MGAYAASQSAVAFEAAAGDEGCDDDGDADDDGGLVAGAAEPPRQGMQHRNTVPPGVLGGRGWGRRRRRRQHDGRWNRVGGRRMGGQRMDGNSRRRQQRCGSAETARTHKWHSHTQSLANPANRVEFVCVCGDFIACCVCVCVSVCCFSITDTRACEPPTWRAILLIPRKRVQREGGARRVVRLLLSYHIYAQVHSEKRTPPTIVADGTLAQVPPPSSIPPVSRKRCALVRDPSFESLLYTCCLLFCKRARTRPLVIEFAEVRSRFSRKMGYKYTQTHTHTHTERRA